MVYSRHKNIMDPNKNVLNVGIRGQTSSYRVPGMLEGALRSACEHRDVRSFTSARLVAASPTNNTMKLNENLYTYSK